MNLALHDDLQVALKDAGAHVLLNRTLDVHRDDHEVHFLAIGALVDLSQHDNVKASSIAEDVHVRVLRALREHVNVEHVQLVS